MRLFRPGLWLFAVISLGAFICVRAGRAQAPARPTAQTAARPPANLAQLMRGIFLPNVNVIYGAQSQDPATIKPADDPNDSPNPLTGSWGGWAAVEKSGDRERGVCEEVFSQAESGGHAHQKRQRRD